MARRKRGPKRGPPGKKSGGRSRSGDSLIAAGIVAFVGLVVAAWVRFAPPPSREAADPGPKPPSYLGFDVSDYPGDAVMKKLRARAPYHFVGYYLKSKNHPDGSWSGRWKTLRELGWSVAIVYVGHQSEDLTETQAMADADEAAAEAAAEGFPPGAIVYLDVEATDAVSAALTRYVRNFVARLATGRYRPGVYCHVKNAADLASALDVPRREIPFWVAGGSAFSLAAAPADSGIAFAKLWQGFLDGPEPTATVSLTVDVSTSSTPTPSGF